MSNYDIRRMGLDELEVLYKHIVQDFSEGEYAPYPMMHQHLLDGDQKALILHEGEQDLAYSICSDNHDNMYVLVSLLALFKEHRDQGIGSLFLNRLRQIYQNKQALLVEVERPDLSKTEEEGNSRRPRIRFYEKAGFFLIEEVDYSIWDIPMHLMALPLVASKEIIIHGIEKCMYELYFNLIGETLIHKMRFSS